MNLSPEEAESKGITLGISAVLMIILGYLGELIVEGSLGTRCLYWAAAMVPFLYIVYELLVGLGDATQLTTEPKVKDLILCVQVVTLLGWLTYPVMCVLPMLGFSGVNAIVAMQVGYYISGFRWKCGIGLIIYCITASRSQVEKDDALLPH